MKHVAPFVLCMIPLFVHQIRCDSVVEIEDCTSDAEPRCTPDCLKRTFCVKNKRYVLNCRVVAGVDFCDPDTSFCTATVNKCNNARLSEYVCMEPDKNFPDLTNCAWYFSCTNNMPILKKCPEGLKFDYLEQKCTDTIFCKEYNTKDFCENRRGKLIHFAQDSSMFVFCASSGPQLLKCPESFKFVKISASCEFWCLVAGIYPDPQYPNRFIECKNSMFRWKINYSECYDGYTYDAAKQSCVVPKPDDAELEKVKKEIENCA